MDTDEEDEEHVKASKRPPPRRVQPVAVPTNAKRRALDPRLTKLYHSKHSEEHDRMTEELLCREGRLGEPSVTTTTLRPCERCEEDGSVPSTTSATEFDYLSIDAILTNQSDPAWDDVRHDTDQVSNDSRDWDSSDYDFIEWPDARPPDELIEDDDEKREDEKTDKERNEERKLRMCPDCQRREVHRWPSRKGRCDACYRYRVKYPDARAGAR